MEIEFKDAIITQGRFQMTANWTLNASVRTAVIGPSGAGKSTLLMAIAGFIPLTSGQLLFDGRDAALLSPAERPVSVLFQDNNLFPHMTIAQNVGLGIRPSLKLTPSEIDRVKQALGSVGLDGMSQRKPSELSGGQQSRAALARALIQDRPLLLLDEPFAALGPALKSEMLELVRDVGVRTGAGLMMVSHDPEDARQICPSTILVADDVAHAPRDTCALLADPPDTLRDYLG